MKPRFLKSVKRIITGTEALIYSLFHHSIVCKRWQSIKTVPWKEVMKVPESELALHDSLLLKLDETVSSV